MKISVVTIVFNGELYIEKTVQSVINQSYKNLEYIIIDGDSKDNTLKLIEKYSNKISKIISEKDAGLYDAMNKGLKICTGDFVLFMNAGDSFHDDLVLENIEKIDHGISDVYYGETIFISEQGKVLGTRSEVSNHKLPKNLKWKDMKFGLVVCHQSILVRKSICSLFDLKYPICADIDWIIKALKRTDKIVQTNFIISNYLLGGISEKKLKITLLERFKVLSKHFGILNSFMAHIWIFLRGSIRKVLN